MNRSYIVHGPTGCGKTRNAERMAAALGLTKVQDNWTPTSQVFEPFDTLYLTASNGPWPDQARHVLSFAEAMGRVPDAVVEPKSRYIHRNGVEYEVVMIANGESTNPKYPPTIVYRGVANGKVWARPACDWDRSMQLVERPASAKVEGTEQVSSTWLAQLRLEYRQFAEAVETLQAKLQSALAQADQLEHERDLLGQALGECIEAAGITTPGVALTGPQLLLFAEDLKAHIGGLRGQLADTAVPMQPLIKDDHGVARFKANKIVNHLLDYASERGCDMTELAKLQFPDEDYMQFAQLIGYSVSGYSDLSYVSDDSRGLAYAKLELLVNAPSAQTQPSPAPTLRAAIDVANGRFEVPVAKWGADLIGEEGRPKVVARLYRSNDKYFPPFAEVQKPLPPGDGTLTVDPLITLAHYDRDVGTLRAANAKLEKELAIARDAASKGDAARQAAGGMEMEIQELRENVAKLKKELRSRWTYASTQATNCAGCGEHKHTPLRVDWMGGYVCLTCIDEKLEELHDAQAQHSVPEGRKLVPVKPTIEMVEAGYEEGIGKPDRSTHARVIEQYDAMLAAAPASSEED
ncbi:TPA: hypothetical protein VDU44_000093 [Pseudomonas aeruginosa]|nr:hypothetical protein [Pseudomonas aeruginosa]